MFNASKTTLLFPLFQIRARPFWILSIIATDSNAQRNVITSLAINAHFSYI